MARKRSTILLLAAVAVIWGIIVFKIFSGIYSKPSVVISRSKAIPAARGEISDSFNIHDYPRDPFLSVLSDTTTLVETAVREEKKPTYIKQVLPKYCGVIQNSDKQNLAIIKTNKKYLFLKQGEKYENLKLVLLKDDKITLQIDNEIYVILFSTDNKSGK